MSQITTHILDTATGKPAQGVPLELFARTASGWQSLAAASTNDDGRVAGLLAEDLVLPAGVYRMHFDTKSYFASQGIQGFYPWADIVFEIDGDGQHYHIPLLLAPYGYSTYRGS